MEFPPKKKVKRIERKTSLSSLSDDLLLLILEYSEEEDIENTRPFRSFSNKVGKKVYNVC